MPVPHTDPWINRPYGYVASVVQELGRHPLRIAHSWLDPCEPRDATIVYAPVSRPDERRALVWDEETGWRTGLFVSGSQGVRTVLADETHLGGGLLPPPAEVALRLLSGHREPRSFHRSHADLCDGFDAALAAYEPAQNAITG